MKKIIPTILISLLAGMLCAQLPSGFNYQAVARDASANILANTALEVHFSILDEFNSAAWTETQSIVTNDLGLFSVLICEDDSHRTGGYASLPEEIDWESGKHYLKIEIYYNSSLVDLGTHPIASVPYALCALNDNDRNPENELQTLSILNHDLTISGMNTVSLPDNVEDADADPENELQSLQFNSSNGILSLSDDPGALSVDMDSRITGVSGWELDEDTVYTVRPVAIGTKQDQVDEPLFEVRNDIGNPVFAVFNDGVMVYVDENKKGTKGGFAVGGYNSNSKGLTNEYLRITPDSVRVYIDVSEGKATKGGFAVGGYNTNKAGVQNYLNVAPGSTGIISPAQNRILWYPLKNAFISGRVLVSDPNFVGENSFASGYEPRAQGMYSQAMGYKPVALGDYSTAIGKNAYAQATNSFAFGDSPIASGQDSYAFGAGAHAYGTGSYAIGSIGRDTLGNIYADSYTTASGNYSFAIGQGCNASGLGSFAAGWGVSASGTASTALSASSEASGTYSVAMCVASQSRGYSSVAIGQEAYAYGDWSVALGIQAYASADYSFAAGKDAYATGMYSNAIGWMAASSGEYASAIGPATHADGEGSFASGGGTTASGKCAIALGGFTRAYSAYETVTGMYNTSYTPVSTTDYYAYDRLFVIGNGSSSASRSNAMTVLKNGRIGLQTITSPSYAFQLPSSSTYYVGSGLAYSWVTYSDSRVKSDRKALPYGLNTVMQLNPQSYIFHNSSFDENGLKIQEDGAEDIGLIAQEVYEHVPEAVTKPEDENTELWGLSYEKLVPVLIKAIQEQQETINHMEEEIQLLKSEIEGLK